MGDLEGVLAESLLEEARKNLQEKYELTYVDYRDELSDEQIQGILDGKGDMVECDVDDAFWEQKADAVQEAIKELFEDPEEAELVLNDTESFETLREMIEDRDTSSPFMDLLKRTGHKLFRYNLDYELEPDSWSWDEEQVETAMREIAEVTGLDPEENREALWTLVAEATYGGQLSVIFYGDVEETLRPVLRTLWGEGPETDRVPKTVTFVNPNLLVLNGWNGSGMDSKVKGRITVPYDIENLRLDGQNKGHGYTWDQVAGVIYSAYDCDIEYGHEDLVTTEPNKENA